MPGSRRPEGLSWGLAAVLFGLAGALRWAGGPAEPGAWALGLYFGLSAAVMSLGNWLERHTLLRMSEEGLEFRRPFQSVRLRWGEIRRVELREGPVGRRISVIGGAGTFSLRAAHEVEIRGKIGDRYGFAESERIMKTILEKADLNREPTPFERGVYYSHD